MASTERQIRVVLIGAGFIADVHARVLGKRRDVEIVSVVDPAVDRARALANRHGVRSVFSSLTAALREVDADVAFVLAPPPLHVELAVKCIEAKLHTFVEKPLALGVAAVHALIDHAKHCGVRLGVNHNLVFDRGHRRLLRELVAGRLGQLEHVGIVHNAPLRQLESGDVGHFMFDSEAAILFEQGVHLFSLVRDLCDAAKQVRATTGRPIRLSDGRPFYDSWSVTMDCATGATAHVTMNFGRAFATTELEAIGSDGVAKVDLRTGSYQRVGRSRWLDVVDHAKFGATNGFRQIGRGLLAFTNYGLTLLRLRRFSDPFTLSMADSIADFLDSVSAGREPHCDGKHALDVTAMCEGAALTAGASLESSRPAVEISSTPVRDGEVAVTGGTGFLGRYLVPELLERGHPVTLVVRRPNNLPTWARGDPRLRIVAGDATDSEAMREALHGARYVVHMATCAAGEDRELVASMVAGVRAVGENCIRHDVERLIFISTTAALYLGGFEPVKGSDQPDSKPHARAAYARGKIAAERALEDLRRIGGLRATVLRPAIVVGFGGTAAHSGVGQWVRDNHCVGWGSGTLPLPFVLARDVATAIANALTAQGIDGKAYNLAGDVEMTAVDYVSRLRTVTGRDYNFHPQPLWLTWLLELGKSGIKVVAGRPGNYQSLRDLRSRGFLAPLDCRDAKRDLAWTPETDRLRFVREAIEIWARRPDRIDVAEPVS